MSSASATSTNSVNPSVNDMDWFAGVAEEELLYYTGNSNDVDSLWAVIGSFVPPPPRPPYLPEEGIATDGLTTCDLCSWALRNDRHSFSLDGTLGKLSKLIIHKKDCNNFAFLTSKNFTPILLKSIFFFIFKLPFSCNY